MKQERALRVAILTSVFVAGDAISLSARLKLQTLERIRKAGFPLDYRLFTHYADAPSPEVLTVSDVRPILSHDGFRSADVQVYEFGIWYPLCDAMFLPTRSAKMAVYHNVTPLHLVDDPIAKRAIQRTLVQRYNLFVADQVLCDSGFNRSDLIELGLPRDRLSVLHLPPTLPVVPRSRNGDGRVEFLYVGRLVRSKGVLDLLGAVDRLARRGLDGFRVSLAGNVTFSDAEVIRKIREAEGRCGGMVRFMGDLSDQELSDLYAVADVLVIPSYHEGFCVPVVDALRAGCRVVAYDSANLPNVTGGVGSLVWCGDVAALADTMAEHVRLLLDHRLRGRPALVPTSRGLMSEDVWREAVAAHLRDFTLEGFQLGFVDALGSVLERTRGEAPVWLSETRSVLAGG